MLEIEESTQRGHSESSRYFTPAKQFAMSCYPDPATWQEWTGEMKDVLTDDFHITSYDSGKPYGYTADQYLQAATLFFRSGVTADDIQRRFPQIGVPEMISTVKDLLVLSNPTMAPQFGFSPKECKRRPLRMLGLEARTKIQEMYKPVFTEAPDVFNSQSDMYQTWTAILREFRNSYANFGRTIDIDPEQAIEIVRMIGEKGYSSNLAAESIHVPSIHNRNIKQVFFVSLYILRRIFPDFIQQKELSIPVYKSSEKHTRTAERMYDLYQERKKLSAHVEENIQRYKSLDGPLPYLNPLQIFVLNAYLNHESVDQMREHLNTLEIDNHGIIIRITNIRNLLKGKSTNGEIPFRTEFRDILSFSLLGDVQLLDTLLKTLGIAHIKILSSENLVGDVVQEISRSGRERLSINDVFKVMRLKADGVPIRTIARSMGQGKNYIFDLISTVELKLFQYYFPGLARSYTALFAQGARISDYLTSHRNMFLQEPPAEFTQEEAVGWEIARRRALGESAADIMATGYTEMAISSLTNLVIISAIRYGLTEKATLIYEGKEISRNGIVYHIIFNQEKKAVVINHQDMSLSRREYDLFQHLIVTHGYISFQLAYTVLYPGVKYTGAEWQKSDILTILGTLQERLGRDIREPDFFLYSNSEELIQINPLRFDFNGDLECNIYYAHSPFGGVENLVVDENGILHMTYADKHDRKMRISPKETEVLQFLLSLPSGEWASVHAAALSLFPDAEPETKESLVRDALSNLKRKLCVAFPHPGYILSDNMSNYRVITYSDLLAENYYFTTSRGIFFLNSSIMALYNERNEQCIMRLTIPDMRTFRQLLHGASAVNQTYKSALRKKLISEGILDSEGPRYKWERDLTFLGVAGELNWRDRIRIQTDGDITYLKVVREDGTQLQFEVDEKDVELLKQDPMDQNHFGNHTNNGSQEETIPQEEIKEIVILAKNDAFQYPLLSPKGEMILCIRKEVGDQAARERLFRSNMRLAFKETHRVCKLNGRYDLFLDMLQEGYLGVEKAIEKFDISRKGKYTQVGRFSTYATWWVRQSINKFLADNAGKIRIPIHRQDFARKVYRLKSEFLRDGMDDSAQAIAFSLLKDEEKQAFRDLKIPLPAITSDTRVPKSILLSYKRRLKKVNEALKPKSVTSLDAEKNQDDEREEYETIADDEPPVEEQIRTSQNDLLKSNLIGKLLSRVEEEDADIIRYRYGLLDGEGHTLEETGAYFHLSRERIRQIEVKTFILFRYLAKQEDQGEIADLIEEI